MADLAQRVSIDLDELRRAIRRAVMQVPAHRVAEEVARELTSGRPVEDVRPTAEDLALAERVLRRRGRSR